MDTTKILDNLLGMEDGESPIRHRTATVTAVNADSTVTVLMGTASVIVHVLVGVVVNVGDVVQLGVWQGDLLILGRVKPTVSHDAVTDGGTFTTTTPATFTHTPNGTPRGVLVFVEHGTPSTDIVTSVTYGGVTMTRVGIAQDAAGEPGAVYAYFLGKGIPTGAQTVSIVHSGSATVKHASAVSVTAPGDCACVAGASVLTADQANPQIAVDTGSSVGVRYDVIYSGLDDPTSLTILAGMTALVSKDFGAFSSRVDRQTAASSGSYTIGYTAASDDVAMLAFGIICPAVRSGGEVFQALRAAAQSISNASYSNFMSWDTISHDRLGGWNRINPSRYTPPIPGWYILSGGVGFANSATTGYRASGWHKNGTLIPGGASAPTHTWVNAAQALPAQTISVPMNGTTDYLELGAYQDTGGALNTDATSQNQPHITITYGGPL